MNSLTWKNTTKATTLTAQIDPVTWFELEVQPGGAVDLRIIRREPRTRSQEQGFRSFVCSSESQERAKAYAELFLASPWEMEKYGL